MSEDLEITGYDGLPLTESETAMLAEEFEAWKSKVGTSVAAKTPDLQSYYDQVWIPSFNSKRMYPVLTKNKVSSALPVAPGVVAIEQHAPGVVPLVNTQKPMPPLLPLNGLLIRPATEPKKPKLIATASSDKPEELFNLVNTYFATINGVTPTIIADFGNDRIQSSTYLAVYFDGTSVVLEIGRFAPVSVSFGVRKGKEDQIQEAIGNKRIAGGERLEHPSDEDIMAINKLASVAATALEPSKSHVVFNLVKDALPPQTPMLVDSKRLNVLVPSDLTDLPGQAHLEASMPNLVPLGNKLPGLVPLKSGMPKLVPLGNKLPGLVPLKSNLPRLVPLAAELPGLLPLESNLPRLVPLAAELPGLLPLEESNFPGLVPFAGAVKKNFHNIFDVLAYHRSYPSEGERFFRKVVATFKDGKGQVVHYKLQPGEKILPETHEMMQIVIPISGNGGIQSLAWPPRAYVLEPKSGPIVVPPGLEHTINANYEGPGLEFFSIYSEALFPEDELADKQSDDLVDSSSRGSGDDSGVFADLVNSRASTAMTRTTVGWPRTNLKSGQIASAINTEYRPALFKAAPASSQPPVKRTLASDPKTSLALQYSVSTLARLFLEPNYQARASTDAKGFVSDLHGASLAVAANDTASVKCYASKFKQHVLANKHPETKMLFATHASVVAAAVRDHAGSDEIYAAIGQHLVLPVPVEQRVPWWSVRSLERSWARYMDMMAHKLAPSGVSRALDVEEEFEIISRHFTRAANGIVNDQVIKTDTGAKTGGIGKDEVHLLVANVAYSMFTTVTNTWFSSPFEKDRRELLHKVVVQIRGYVESIQSRFGAIAPPSDYTSADNMEKMQDNVRHYISKEINAARRQGGSTVPSIAARKVSDAIKRSWDFNTYKEATSDQRLTQDFVTVASAVLLFLIASQQAMNMRRPKFDLTKELNQMERRLQN